MKVGGEEKEGGQRQGRKRIRVPRDEGAQGREGREGGNEGCTASGTHVIASVGGGAPGLIRERARARARERER
jgi:hypothetical protein